jgi:hypothetical protein
MLVDRGIMLPGFKSSDIVDNDCTDIQRYVLPGFAVVVAIRGLRP